MTPALLRGHTLGAAHQDRSNMGHMNAKNDDWHHETTTLQTPWEDRPHFTMEDRIPEHNVFGQLRLMGTGKMAQVVAHRHPPRPMIRVKIRDRDGVELEYKSIHMGANNHCSSFSANQRDIFDRQKWYRFSDGAVMWPADQPFPEQAKEKS